MEMTETTQIRVCTGEACGVSRRAFLGGTMMAVAALLAACGDAGGNPVGPGDVNAVLRVSDYPALAQVGGIVRVSTGGGAVAVVRTSADAFAAFSMRCPHQGTTVNISNGAFVCPNHGARFNAQGQWTGGQRTSNLVSIPVTYDAASGTLTLGS